MACFALQSVQCAAPTAQDSSAHSNSSNTASDDENAGKDFFDVADGEAVLPDLPSLYESIHDTFSVSNTPPPAGNEVMLPSASVDAISG